MVFGLPLSSPPLFRMLRASLRCSVLLVCATWLFPACADDTESPLLSMRTSSRTLPADGSRAATLTVTLLVGDRAAPIATPVDVLCVDSDGNQSARLGAAGTGVIRVLTNESGVAEFNILCGAEGNAAVQLSCIARYEEQRASVGLECTAP